MQWLWLIEISKEKSPHFFPFLYVLHFPIHTCLRADCSSPLPLYMTACQIYVVPVCRSTSSSHLFPSHFHAFLLYPCGRLQFKEQQTGSLPTPTGPVHEKASLPYLSRPDKEGPSRMHHQCESTNRQQSSVHRQMSVEETGHPFLALLFCHTHALILEVKEWFGDAFWKLSCSKKIAHWAHLSIVNQNGNEFFSLILIPTFTERLTFHDFHSWESLSSFSQLNVKLSLRHLLLLTDTQFEKKDTHLLYVFGPNFHMITHFWYPAHKPAFVPDLTLVKY